MSEAASVNGNTTHEEWEGPVLDVVQQLVGDHARADAIIAIFSKLVARNGELELLLAKLFGRRNKGEGVPTGQLQLFLDRLKAAADSDEQGEGAGGDGALVPCSPAAEAAALLRTLCGLDQQCEPIKPPPPPPAPQPSVRKPFPEGLRRETDLIPVAPDQRACPRCGAERECYGHDIVEVADLKPAEIFVRMEMREKLRCGPCDGEHVRSPVGDRVVSGGRFGSRLVAQLLVDKYDDGLPLHRQRQRFARMGLPIAVSTMADQVRWASELLDRIWGAARRAVLAGVVMHLDATGLPVLARDPETHKKVGTGKRFGTLWGYLSGQTALYVYCSTGHGKGQSDEDIGPAQFLAERSGFTVADAASIFDSSFKRPDLIECGCNMHARRYFFKALDGGDDNAALPIAAFKKLYEVEHKARDLDDAARLLLRQEESRPVYNALVQWCRVHGTTERPSSALARASNYLLNHEEALTRFLTDGRIPIDNGAVERLHVRAALTRKNYLFAGSDAGGRRAATAYTILGSCRLAGVNPVEYLADVLPRLAGPLTQRQVDDLLPAAWALRAAR